MGAWKPLLPMGNSTIIEITVDTALSVCSRVIVVAGYRHRELRELFMSRPRIVVVTNERWHRGMLSSIRTGVVHIETERFFITPADLPGLGPEVYRAILAEPPADVIIPTYGGRGGHPVLLGRRVIPAVIEELDDTRRMRDVIAGFDRREMAWPDDSIVTDVDTSDDYRQAKERFCRGGRT